MGDFIMTTMLPNLLTQEDAPSSRPSGSSIATIPTADDNACLIARIGWSHRQAMKAVTTLELQEWCAETQGLIDALLQRDCMYKYQDRPLLLERYAMGLQDGRVLIQAAKIRPSCRHRYNQNLRQC